ncbi:CAF17-like 4Fe-4S cluster assembly/insertion protein YgfZ [Rhodococcus sp. CH91]|uniref:CAF17-like 4Fe-4S cluster assembly/insertion protein YgfZ n=1 Tax=Rhodococcus sp. CH91 TaxID=2910256 RepID=UPI001F4B5078|nr:folate-binding protein YgfZ [Rhodococcus sp. CH91]
MTESPIVSESALLALPDAVASPAGGPDAGLPWHYGDPLGEQRAASTGAAVVDRSTRFVIRISGDERLSWLHTISSQHVSTLPEGTSAENLGLDANGRVEHHFVQTDLDGVTWIDTEASRGPELLAFLQKMVFWAKAEPRDGNELAVLSLLGPEVDRPAVLSVLGLDSLPAEIYAAVALPSGGFVRRMPWPTDHSFDLLIPREALTATVTALIEAGVRPAGSWAFEALRVEALRPRIGVDTDERTIPHEARWIGSREQHGAVHLDKGCYRGQETVARVHNLGKPPRRLVLVHLDGSADGRPETGDDITAGGRPVGRIGTVVDHYELGPVALALVKRTITPDTALVAGPCAASIDPDSIPPDDGIQAGRAAVERLRGR